MHRPATSAWNDRTSPILFPGDAHSVRVHAIRKMPVARLPRGPDAGRRTGLPGSPASLRTLGAHTRSCRARCGPSRGLHAVPPLHQAQLGGEGWGEGDAPGTSVRLDPGERCLLTQPSPPCKHEGEGFRASRAHVSRPSSLSLHAATFSSVAATSVTTSTGVSQPCRSTVVPSNRPKNAFCNARVTGPGLPVPTGLRSTERTGVISAAVPVRKISSEQYS